MSGNLYVKPLASLNFQNNHFNLYVVNLAVTDLAVAITAMSFYTFDVLLGILGYDDEALGEVAAAEVLQ